MPGRTTEPRSSCSASTPVSITATVTPAPRVADHARSNDVRSSAHCCERRGSFSPAVASDRSVTSVSTLRTVAPVAATVFGRSPTAAVPRTTARRPSGAADHRPQTRRRHDRRTGQRTRGRTARRDRVRRGGVLERARPGPMCARADDETADRERERGQGREHDHRELAARDTVGTHRFLAPIRTFAAQQPCPRAPPTVVSERDPIVTASRNVVVIALRASTQHLRLQADSSVSGPSYFRSACRRDPATAFASHQPKESRSTTHGPDHAAGSRAGRQYRAVGDAPAPRPALEPERHRLRPRRRRCADVLQPVGVRSTRIPTGRARGNERARSRPRERRRGPRQPRLGRDVRPRPHARDRASLPRPRRRVALVRGDREQPPRRSRRHGDRHHRT